MSKDPLPSPVPQQVGEVSAHGVSFGVTALAHIPEESSIAEAALEAEALFAVSGVPGFDNVSIQDFKVLSAKETQKAAEKAEKAKK